MKKIIKLTESDLVEIVKRVISEDNEIIARLAMDRWLSPRKDKVRAAMSPSDNFDDEFEYADNFFFRLLRGYEEETFYDELMEFMKDEYAQEVFSFYFSDMG